MTGTVGPLEPRIPFIDPTGLLSAMEQAYGRGPALSPAEVQRDEFRGARSFQLLGAVPELDGNISV